MPKSILDYSFCKIYSHLRLSGDNPTAAIAA
jgi:hypothetical protein